MKTSLFMAGLFLFTFFSAFKATAMEIGEPTGARSLTCQQAQGDYPAQSVAVTVLFKNGALVRVLSRDPYGYNYMFSPRYDGDNTVVMQASKGGHWGIFYCNGAMARTNSVVDFTSTSSGTCYVASVCAGISVGHVQEMSLCPMAAESFLRDFDGSCIPIN